MDLANYGWQFVFEAVLKFEQAFRWRWALFFKVFFSICLDDFDIVVLALIVDRITSLIDKGHMSKFVITSTLV